MLPLALVNASGESRDREGPLTVTPSESVAVTDGAWRMWEGTENLVRNPLVDAALSDIVANGGSGEWSTTDAPDGFEASFRFTGNGTSGFQYAHFVVDQPPEASGIRTFTQSGWVKADEGIDLASFFRLRGFIDDAFTNNDKTEWHLGSGEWMRVAVTHESREGQELSTTLHACFGTSLSNFDVRPSVTIYMTGLQVEEKPYATPFTVGTRVPGTLQIPLAQAPASVIVRTRQAGVAVTERAVLQDGAGTFGEHGVITWDGTTLTVGTTRQSDVLGVIAYGDVPSDGQVARVAGMETWTWDGLLYSVGGIVVGEPRSPIGGIAIGSVRSPVGGIVVGGSR